MNHQIGRKKLNMKPSHKRSVIRNQAISLISYGHLVTTKARAQEVRKFVERMVTIAKKGETFNAFRQARSLLPYKDEALQKLFSEIAPKYADRMGGYTRIVPLGQRVADTACIARLEWV